MEEEPTKTIPYVHSIKNNKTSYRFIFKKKPPRNIHQNSELKKQKEKNQNRLKIILIIALSILIAFLLAAIISFIIFALKSKKLKKTPINISISELSYKDAGSLLGSKIIDKNFILLNQTIENLNNSLIASKNTNISEINASFSAFPSFLDNPTRNALKIVKADLEFYKRKYEELSENTNNLSLTTSELFENIYTPLFILKEELIKLTDKYKETLKNLCIPLLSQKELLKIIEENTVNEKKKKQLEEDKIIILSKMEKYMNESDKLNTLYNKIFDYFDKVVKIINDEINDLPEIIRDTRNQIEEGISQFEDLIKQFTDPNKIQLFHESLMKIKNNFLSIKSDFIKKKNEIEKKVQILENQYKKISGIELRNLQEKELAVEDPYDNLFNDYSNEIQSEENETIRDLENTSEEISNGIAATVNHNTLYSIEIPRLRGSFLILDLILNSLSKSYKIIRREQKIVSREVETSTTTINVQEETSLDLMFIMDLTGSMDPFIEKAKENVLNIINRIVIECPGIDVYLSFIGYRDVDDISAGDYTIIDFTKNHYQFQNSIKGVTASGGNGDWPEDMAWGFETALGKSWKNDARFAVLLGDTPCHGNKYHDLEDFHPNGVPGRKDIEESIKELAEKNISLFCMEITNLTKKMFQIFGNIYNNYKNVEFQIVSLTDPEELPNIIATSAAGVYIFKKSQK